MRSPRAGSRFVWDIAEVHHDEESHLRVCAGRVVRGRRGRFRGFDAAVVVWRQDHVRIEGQGQGSHRHVRRWDDVQREASQARLQETRRREELKRMNWRDGLIRSGSGVETSRSAWLLR